MTGDRTRTSSQKRNSLGYDFCHAIIDDHSNKRPPRHGYAPAAPRQAKQMFLRLPCSGCHAGAGRRAAFGPKIVGQGLSTAIIRTTIENGRGQMPAS